MNNKSTSPIKEALRLLRKAPPNHLSPIPLLDAHFQQTGIAHLFFFEHVAHDHGPVLNVTAIFPRLEPASQDALAFFVGKLRHTNSSQRDAQNVKLTEIEAETLDLRTSSHACQRI